jgi:hypothetical protein
MINILILTGYIIALIAGLASVVWVNSELREDGKILEKKENEK